MPERFDHRLLARIPGVGRVGRRPTDGVYLVKDQDPGTAPTSRHQAVGRGAREAERPPEFEGRVLGRVAVQAERQAGDASETELIDDLEGDAALAVAAAAV